MTGTLKGYDALMNLVLDEVEEQLRGAFALLDSINPPSPHPFLPQFVCVCVLSPGPDAETSLPPNLADDEGNETTRPLGLVVARGTLLVVISPLDGSEEIANPFLQADDD